MANLLSKFRIDYSSLTMVQDITEAPQESTKKLFEEVTKKFTDESASEGTAQLPTSTTKCLILALGKNLIWDFSFINGSQF